MSLINDEPRLTPSTSRLLAEWVPAQPWSGGVPLTGEPVGWFRFEDPDGEAEIETCLARTLDGRVVQVPLTHRTEPLEHGEHALLGTTEHPVLGTSWVYDGCADPAYFAALCTTILAGRGEAAPRVPGGGRLHAPTIRVRGSGGVITDDTTVDSTAPMKRFEAGGITVMHTGVLQVGLQRMVGEHAPDDGSGERGPTLTGTWPGVDEPTLLAFFRRPRRRPR